MFLCYGNYIHANNECAVMISRQGVFNAHGLQTEIVEQWNIQGMLMAGSVAELSVAIRAMEAAYASSGRNVGLYVNANTPTAHGITSAAARGGVRVVVPPSFPVGYGAEYTTFRTYSIVLEATFGGSGVAGGLLSWSESIEIQGTGGPRWGYLQPMQGPPQQQIFSETSTIWMFQQGSAIGLGVYPTPSPPLLGPDQEHEESHRVHRELPADNSHHRRVSWSYTFESHASLVGQPREQTIN